MDGEAAGGVIGQHTHEQVLGIRGQVQPAAAGRGGSGKGGTFQLVVERSAQRARNVRRPAACRAPGAMPVAAALAARPFPAERPTPHRGSFRPGAACRLIPAYCRFSLSRMLKGLRPTCGRRRAAGKTHALGWSCELCAGTGWSTPCAAPSRSRSAATLAVQSSRSGPEREHTTGKATKHDEQEQEDASGTFNWKANCRLNPPT